jgi:hypothetical protein
VLPVNSEILELNMPAPLSSIGIGTIGSLILLFTNKKLFKPAVATTAMPYFCLLQLWLPQTLPNYEKPEKGRNRRIH